MLTTSAHISPAKGGRKDESYHVSKEERKVFGDSINDRNCRHTGRVRALELGSQVQMPALSLTSCVTLSKPFPLFELQSSPHL